ncbi:MAG: hypothetical protein JNJ61_22740 [Anaerolineae bacterium]|nr:hypothetical protein [Anaerolineae bacterium]
MAVPAPSQLLGFSDVRLQYHFDTPETDWDIFTTDGNQAIFRINGGALEGAVVPNRGYIGSLNHRRHRDISIEAQVEQTSGATGNDFGLLCRADAIGNGYYFVISSAGQFAILKATADRIDPLQLVPWQPSSAIRQGEGRNMLRAVCVGDYLAFFANDVFLAEVRDSQFDAGEAGVVLAAVGQTVWVRFDSITLRDPMILGIN